MRVLFVASYKEAFLDNVVPFVKEQGEALRKAGVELEYFTIKGKGIKGYLKEIKPLKQKIKEFQPDVIHAHYGMSGLLANLQRGVPVVTTYHGSDINNQNARAFSLLSIAFSKHNIFVSQKLIDIAKPKHNYSLMPCGVDIDNFSPIDKSKARERLGLKSDHQYVLFAGAFDNGVKNSALAKEAMTFLPDVTLLEMKGYSREEVAALYYACDAFLMTSLSEGSPQVIKEAMICGCPIVSVDVGDVANVISETEGCYIVERNSRNIAEKLKIAITFARTCGRERLLESGLDNDTIAKRLISIYDNFTKE